MILCIIMLVSLLPVTVASTRAMAEVQSGVIGYNLGEDTVLIGSDAALLEDGTVAALFETDGSFTIELEEDAFFPYEVKFTADNAEETVWFMTPEDSVAFAGHAFYVHSAQNDPTAITQIGLTLNGQYYPAYPQHKAFEPQAELASMLPLRERYFTLDMTDYFPNELKNLQLNTVVSGLQERGADIASDADIAVWAKWGYYDENGDYVSENDNYTVIGESRTIDFSNDSPSSYSTTESFSIELIVGTVDQLNSDNVRYHLTVKTANLNGEDMLTASIADAERQPIGLETCGTRMLSNRAYYYNDSVPDYGSDFSVVAMRKDYHGDQHYISFGLSESFMEKHPGREFVAEVYEGFYETEDGIPADAENLAAQLWNADVTAEGGILADYRRSRNFAQSPKYTVVLKDGDTVLTVLPMVIALSSDGIELEVDRLYAQEETGRRDVLYSGAWITPSSELVEESITLEPGYPADGEYYVCLSTAKPTGGFSTEYFSGTQYIKAAYFGAYPTIAAAEEAEAEDIKEQLFPSSYYGSGGYLANFKDDITFSVFDINEELYLFKLTAREREPDMGYSLNRWLYVDSENEGQDRELAASYPDWNWVSALRMYVYTYQLYYGYSKKDEYYIGLSVENSYKDADNSNFGLANVEKAVFGKYNSLEEAENETDIKEQLLSNPKTAGYRTNFEQEPLIFTIFGKIGSEVEGQVLHVAVRTELTEAVENPLSSDTYFQMEGAETSEDDRYAQWVMPYTADSYYYNGYQTVLLLDERYDNESGSYVAKPVTDETIVPIFFHGNKTKMFAGLDKVSGSEQISRQTEIPFVSGQAIQYSAASEDSGHLKNYWVTFLTQQSGAKLFVNGTNDESRYVAQLGEDGEPLLDEAGEEIKIPSREIFIQEDYGNKHDVFFANIGDEQMTGLYARLENAAGIQLDEYWTIGETNSLSAFTTTRNRSNYGELMNVGKIRLLPILNSEGGIDFQGISGILVIGYDSDGDEIPEEEVRIQLTGIVGDLAINTETVQDGVKYVPYSQLIQTNNMYADDAVTFTLVEGNLPKGVELREKTGEIYGLPMETGTYTFTIEATAEYTSKTFSACKEFTLTILENTDENVDAATDEGYQVWMTETEEHPIVTSQEFIDRIISTYKTLTFVSEGEYGEFVALYIDGEPLVEGVDFQSSDGSAVMVVLERTLRTQGRGTHTISMEFRDNGQQATADSYSPMHRTSRNYESTVVEYHRPISRPVVTPTPTPPPVPVDDGVGPIPLEYTTVGDTATLKSISAERDKALNAERNPDAIVDLSDEKGDVHTIVLPAAIVDKLVEKLTDGDSQTGTLTVKLSSETLDFDETTLKAIQEQNGGKDTVITVMPIVKEDLAQDQKNALDVQTFYGGIRVTATVDGKPIKSFLGGRVTFSIQVKDDIKEEPVSAFYIAEDGILTRHATTKTGEGVSFRTSHFSDFVVLGDKAVSYKDTNEDSWYWSFVEYAARNGLMLGVEENTFAPNAAVNRAMFVQMLYSLEGKPAVSGAVQFADVAEDSWYSYAVNWAAEAGIVKGMGHGVFVPMSEITREQLAVMLYNYAEYKSYRTDHLETLSRFDDADTVSDWAIAAMQWAVNEKLFIGMGAQTLNPQGCATRVQAAKVLAYFCESIEQ